MNIVHFVNDIHETPRAHGKRARRRKARVDEILAAASTLVARDGLDALTLGRLGQELDLVPAALYRYFDGKDALLAALGGDTVRDLRERFDASRAAARRRAQADGVGDGVAALGELFAIASEYLSLPRAAPERFRLVSLLLADSRKLVGDEAAAAHVPAIAAFLEDVRSLFDRATADGTLDPGDAMDRTAVLWAALQGTAQLEKLARFDAQRFAATRLGAIAVTSLLTGFGASAEQLRAADRLAATRLNANATDRKPRKK